jgi:hypothetical protein
VPTKDQTFKLLARVNSDKLEAISPALARFIGTAGTLKKSEDEKGGFIVEAKMQGSSAKELNRTLLSTLRKVEKKMTLRAEWSFEGITERYFDYVLKKKEKSVD